MSQTALPRHSIRQAYFAPAGHLRPQPFARRAARAVRRATAPCAASGRVGLDGFVSVTRHHPAALSSISVNLPISSADRRKRQRLPCRHLGGPQPAPLSLCCRAASQACCTVKSSNLAKAFVLGGSCSRSLRHRGRVLTVSARDAAFHIERSSRHGERGSLHDMVQSSARLVTLTDARTAKRQTVAAFLVPAGAGADWAEVLLQMLEDFRMSHLFDDTTTL